MKGNKISGKTLSLILMHLKSYLQLVKNLLKVNAIGSSGIRKKLRIYIIAENYVGHVHKVLNFRWHLSSQNLLQGAAGWSGNYHMA